MNDYTLRTNVTELSTFTLSDSAFAPILVRSPLTGDAYYRSLTFTTHTGINPLISAASALLIINARLRHCEQYQNVANLYQCLVHEVKVFETRARNLDYRAEAIMVARYVLCACIDETIMQTAFGQQQHWQQQLLNTFQREQSAGERFFLILERISADAAHHLDLLELIYLCLSLGYEGQYHHIPHGKMKLDAIIDNLYQRIRRERQELKPLLTTKLNISPIDTKTKKRTISLRKYILPSCLFFIVLVSGLSYFIDRQISRITAEFQTITASQVTSYDHI
jgi:type VI secretion system protein ImpK